MAGQRDQPQLRAPLDVDRELLQRQPESPDPLGLQRRAGRAVRLLPALPPAPVGVRVAQLHRLRRQLAQRGHLRRRRATPRGDRWCVAGRGADHHEPGGPGTGVRRAAVEGTQGEPGRPLHPVAAQCLGQRPRQALGRRHRDRRGRLQRERVLGAVRSRRRLRAVRLHHPTGQLLRLDDH